MIKPPLTPPPSAWFRRRNILIVLILGMLALTVVVSLLPSVIASRLVINPLLARMLSNDLQAEVGDVSLGWFSPLVVEALQVDGNPGGEIFRIEKIETQRTLLGLLTNRKRIGRVQIEQPTVNLTVLEEGTNFQALIKALTPTDRSKEKKIIDTELEAWISGLRLDIRKGEQTKPLLATSLADFSLFYSVVNDGPQLSLEQSVILDHADLTPELFEYGLQFVLPIVADATAIDGQISLTANSAHLPLHSILDFDADAVVTIHAVGVEAKSPLIKKISSTLAKIFRGPEVTRVLLVDGSEIHVSVEDRFVRHEGVRFGLPQIDPELVLETSGTVGFDRSLDLMLNVPVPMQLLLSNPDQFAEGTSKIRSFSVPIKGTIDEPVIEWSAAKSELLTLLSIASESWEGDESGALRAGILKTAEDIFGSDPTTGQAIGIASDAALEWYRKRQARKQAEAEPSDDAPEAEGSNESSDAASGGRRRLGDFLRNRLRGSGS